MDSNWRPTDFKKPKDREGAEELLQIITEAQTEIFRLNNIRQARVSEINREFASQTRPIDRYIHRVVSALHAFHLESGSGGLMRTRYGFVGIRTNPPHVSIRFKLKTVIRQLKEAGLDRFVRVTEDVNKRAILDEPEAVKGIRGITVKKRQEFEVRTRRYPRIRYPFPRKRT